MNCSEHMYSVTHNNTFAFNGTLYVEIFAGSWECRSVREAAVGPRRAPGGTTCRSRQAWTTSAIFRVSRVTSGGRSGSAVGRGEALRFVYVE